MSYPEQDIPANRIERIWLATVAATTAVAACTDIVAVSTASSSLESTAGMFYSITGALLAAGTTFAWMREASGQ